METARTTARGICCGRCLILLQSGDLQSSDAFFAFLISFSISLVIQFESERPSSSAIFLAAFFSSGEILILIIFDFDIILQTSEITLDL